MRNLTRLCLLLLVAAVATGCVNQREQRKREILKFLQTSAGEYVNESGEELFLAPVHARMIGFDTMYVERVTPRGTTSRLVALEPSADGRRIVQMGYTFTQQNQWRDLRRQPELLSALQPNDVRAVGTCDIRLAEDQNSVTYSCGGSPPQTFKRVQQPVEE